MIMDARDDLDDTMVMVKQLITTDHQIELNVRSQLSILGCCFDVNVGYRTYSSGLKPCKSLSHEHKREGDLADRTMLA